MKTKLSFLILFLGVMGYGQIGNKEIIMDLSKPELRMGEKTTEDKAPVNHLSEEALRGYSKEITSEVTRKIKMTAPDKISNKIAERFKNVKDGNPKLSNDELKIMLSNIIFEEVKNGLLVDLGEYLPNELDKVLPYDLAKKITENIVSELPDKISHETAQRCHKRLSENLLGVLSGDYEISTISAKLGDEIIKGFPEKIEKELTVKLLEGKPEVTVVKKQKSKWLSIRAREMPHIKIINGNPLKYNYKIDTKELAFFNEETPAEKEVETVNEGTSGTEGVPLLVSSTIENLMGRIIILEDSINSLNSHFELFYTDLLGRNSLDTKEVENKRKDFWNKVTNYNDQSDELLNELEKLKDSTGYKETKEKIYVTKGKAKKLKEELKKKLYGFDFVTYTLPLDVQGKNIDVIEFRLRRFDKETKEEDTGFAPQPYNIWIRGGLKIDVSAGVFFTTLFDDVFEKKDDPVNTENKIIIKKNQGDFDFAFGSSINVHSRWTSWLNMGGNLGVAFTTNQKFQILSGVNFIFGKQERIILTAGFAMGKVDRLANSYKEGGSYNLGAEGKIPTDTQFKFGHFFGVTYNLSKVKKISLEKGIEQ